MRTRYVVPLFYYNFLMDTIDSKTRSKMMSSVRSKDTKLEIEIRKRLLAMEFRYRLHSNRIPGKPDLDDSQEDQHKKIS